MKTLLSLEINLDDFLQIASTVNDNEIINLHNSYLFFYLKHNQISICLDKVSVGYDLYYIAERIESCLNMQRHLSSMLLDKNADLGLLWHQHWQNVTMAEKRGKPFSSLKWPGMELYFLENKGSGFDSCITWLYSDQKGQIVMQVNNIYPWFFKDAPSSDLDISYDDWLPQYKILYKTVILKDVAQKWVKDLHGLYAMLELNT